MDRFDALILDALQRDTRQTAEALAAGVGLSADACRKRANRLRAEGYVEADAARLSPEKLGRGLMLVVEVTLMHERPAALERFKQRMHAAPEVMQCYYVTGDADFILILSARDMADYRAFTQRHFFDEENVARSRTSAVMERVKTGFTMPVPGAAEDTTLGTAPDAPD